MHRSDYKRCDVKVFFLWQKIFCKNILIFINLWLCFFFFAKTENVISDIIIHQAIFARKLNNIYVRTGIWLGIVCVELDNAFTYTSCMLVFDLSAQILIQEMRSGVEYDS